MNPNDFVQWDVTRNNQLLHLYGQVVSIDQQNNQVELLLPGIGNTIVSLDDGILQVIDKPDQFDALQQQLPQQQPVKLSKKHAAIQLYKQMVADNGGVAPKRETVIKAFEQQIGLTAKGASTYHHSCKHDPKWQ